MKAPNVLAIVSALALACVAHAGGPLPLPAEAATGLAAYKLGPGDRLRITVFGETTLTGEYQVTDDGSVAFPLIGNVPAAQFPLVALRDAIAAKLAAGYVKDPRVSVEVLAYRPYYILGEVNRAGQYPFVVGLRLDQAVAAAGGFTYRANMGKAFLRRAGDPAEYKVDLRHGNVTVMPGDTLRIGERYF